MCFCCAGRALAIVTQFPAPPKNSLLPEKNSVHLGEEFPAPKRRELLQDARSPTQINPGNRRVPAESEKVPCEIPCHRECEDADPTAARRSTGFELAESDPVFRRQRWAGSNDSEFSSA